MSYRVVIIQGSCKLDITGIHILNYFLKFLNTLNVYVTDLFLCFIKRKGLLWMISQEFFLFVLEKFSHWKPEDCGFNCIYPAYLPRVALVGPLCTGFYSVAATIYFVSIAMSCIWWASTFSNVYEVPWISPVSMHGLQMKLFFCVSHCSKVCFRWCCKGLSYLI